MYEQFISELETSRSKLLNVVPNNVDVTFIRIFGNIGDDLIYAGTRQLLRDVDYREISVRNLAEASGSVAIVAGGGSWCNAFQLMPGYLKAIEQRFQSVVVFPSSFDVSVESVKEALLGTKALVFARELESYSRIRDLCRAELAHDAAFFFDYRPYQRQGHGILNVFRTDPEALPFSLPTNNNDISVTCETLDEWLWTIASQDTIQTDRTHVTIAAALLGKHVKYRPSNYHKLPAIVRFALSEFPVERLQDVSEHLTPHALRNEPFDEAGSRIEDWPNDSEYVSLELSRLVPAGSALVLVDDGKLDLPHLLDRHVIPFTERAGLYWGPPPDDDTALRELKRLLEVRPAVVAIAWPAFWWLNRYPDLRHYLDTTFPCVHRDDRLVVYDLRSTGL